VVLVSSDDRWPTSASGPTARLVRGIFVIALSGDGWLA
jgi:hypothetical protein